MKTKAAKEWDEAAVLLLKAYKAPILAPDTLVRVQMVVDYSDRTNDLDGRIKLLQDCRI